MQGKYDFHRWRRNPSDVARIAVMIRRAVERVTSVRSEQADLIVVTRENPDNPLTWDDCVP